MVIYNSLPNDGVKFLNNKIYLKQSEEDMTPVVKDPLGTNFATIATWSQRVLVFLQTTFFHLHLYT